MPPSHHNTAQRSALSPQMRSWVDNCLVPILVREYLAQLECEKSLAPEAKAAVDSPPAHAAIEGGR